MRMRDKIRIIRDLVNMADQSNPVLAEISRRWWQEKGREPVGLIHEYWKEGLAERIFAALALAVVVVFLVIFLIISCSFPEYPVEKKILMGMLIFGPFFLVGFSLPLSHLHPMGEEFLEAIAIVEKASGQKFKMIAMSDNLHKAMELVENAANKALCAQAKCVKAAQRIPPWRAEGVERESELMLKLLSGIAPIPKY